MVTAAQAAALIAAISFAVLAVAGVYTLVKLSRLISEASRAVAQWRADSDTVLGRADSAVQRAHEQLARADQIAASMDEVSGNLADLTADMSILTGAMRTLVGGPLGRLAAFAYGVRRAIALRRPPGGPRRLTAAMGSAPGPGRPGARTAAPALPPPARESRPPARRRLGARRPDRTSVADGPERQVTP